MADESVPPFRVLEHTADIGFEAFGRTRAEVLANAARALEDLIVPLGTIAARDETLIRVEGRDDVSLLVNWLSELLFRFDAEGRLFSEFEVSELGAASLEARARGEAFDRSRHPVKVQVKAITYHQALFEKTPQGWRARVYVDI